MTDLISRDEAIERLRMQPLGDSVVANPGDRLITVAQAITILNSLRAEQKEPK